jgi:hypothetical protein
MKWYVRVLSFILVCIFAFRNHDLPIINSALSIQSIFYHNCCVCPAALIGVAAIIQRISNKKYLCGGVHRDIETQMNGKIGLRAMSVQKRYE